jgi:LemA protein
MKAVLVVIASILAFFFVLAFAFFRIYTGTWDNLNTKFQAVDSGKAHYSAALEVCSQKIKGVWEIANQYMAHESQTFQGVAEARSGYLAAEQAFKQASQEGKDTKALTKAGSEAVSAALAFRIQVEAYPQLRAVETATENIRNMEESTNEIKTALDDWIMTIQAYNSYRGNFWPNLIGHFIPRFPANIEYFKSDIKKLDIDTLNPAEKK